ncbi:hypothetical protein BX611_0826 [Lutibacter oceani]|uniref:Uncharacterized protein n=1 Tax=Lutibacter oceani TaxID=1853311 RepID=A0A3D9S3X4_9FLAO|nr:hypothetical protein [Lutibacter oceani]REE83535.1 hypothetical protein BX611_0826 [Lutibacter oceani]
MKSIKFIFAFLLFTSLFISCTSDSAEDEELYAKEQVQATGEEGSADITRTRD